MLSVLTVKEAVLSLKFYTKTDLNWVTSPPVWLLAAGKRSEIIPPFFFFLENTQNLSQSGMMMA